MRSFFIIVFFFSLLTNIVQIPCATAYETFRCSADSFRKNVGDDGDECVLYVRDETDILNTAFYGEAYTCFDKAKNAGYATGSDPKESAIIVFNIDNSKDMPVGHVGIVKKVDGN